jgi:hypothetical protein
MDSTAAGSSRGPSLPNAGMGVLNAPVDLTKPGAAVQSAVAEDEVGFFATSQKNH